MAEEMLPRRMILLLLHTDRNSAAADPAAAWDSDMPFYYNLSLPDHIGNPAPRFYVRK